MKKSRGRAGVRWWIVWSESGRFAIGYVTPYLTGGYSAVCCVGPMIELDRDRRDPFRTAWGAMSAVEAAARTEAGLRRRAALGDLEVPDHFKETAS